MLEKLLIENPYRAPCIREKMKEKKAKATMVLRLVCSLTPYPPHTPQRADIPTLLLRVFSSKIYKQLPGPLPGTEPKNPSPPLTQMSILTWVVPREGVDGGLELPSLHQLKPIPVRRKLILQHLLDFQVVERTNPVGCVGLWSLCEVPRHLTLDVFLQAKLLPKKQLFSHNAFGLFRCFVP
ncbi:hypothetical protein OnM2_019105 [Erysiphe neolycopersici]|uniref:Uncharacterized protein n=1 Tax=Erysiphe neolycopersici TaxID=212602 RepID=A0A420I3U7_9PEZI|nr:hypothetical protein OnM2_019105 [Erysiphe neolycopersici]